jgi:cleavage and polyadenylation specificity factor subunit 1
VQEEPYKIIVFGKSAAQMEVTAVEFLPHEKQLYILAADSDKFVHVLQYDPENPRTQAGRRLLHRGSFFAGHLPTSMHMLPRADAQPPQDGSGSSEESAGSDDDDDDDEKPRRRAGAQVLVATQTGALGLMTPVDETTHLRLSALQTYLLGQLEQPCGLNARGYRVGAGQGVGESGGEARGADGGERGAGGVAKGVVDGALRARWMELSRQRRAEGCDRVGVDEAAVRRDLEAVDGSMLGLL